MIFTSNNSLREEPLGPYQFEYTVTNEHAKKRIDKLLAELTSFSRAKVQMLIKEGQLNICGQICYDISHITRLGEHLILNKPIKTTVLLEADDSVAFEVVFEDEDIVVINKPVGLVVHPGVGNEAGTLVHGLLSRHNLFSSNDMARPGIVHRLDKDTSGLMVVAKTESAHNALSAQIAARQVKRIYHTIVWKIPHKTEGTIKNNIGRSKYNRQQMAVVPTGGKIAITHYSLLKTYGHYASLLECRLETGRTHQIRVHLSHLGHSIIGDQTYGNNKRSLANSGLIADPLISGFGRQALHAHQLAFTHPLRPNEQLHFISDMPKDLRDLIDKLQSLSHT